MGVWHSLEFFVRLFPPHMGKKITQRDLMLKIREAKGYMNKKIMSHHI